MIYECDDCKKTFVESGIWFKPLATNLQIVGASFMIYNVISKKASRISSMDQVKDGDCAMHCPHCGKVHLFGFNTVKENEMNKKKEELWVVKCQMCEPATCQYQGKVKVRNSSEATAANLNLCNYSNTCGHQSDLIQIGIDLKEFE
jgi:hypothetical protein